MHIEQIAASVAQLKHYFSTGKTRDINWRIAQLNLIKRFTTEQQDAIDAALQADLGKCQLEAWSGEIGYVLSEVDYAIKNIKKWAAKRRVSTPIIAQPGHSYLQPQPLGTVLIMGAWNYPYQLVVTPLIAAIAAGNCAVLKPSELAPATAEIITKLVSYLDTNAVVAIQGGVEESTAVLRQPFDHILYTGGEAVGKIVMRAAAEHLTPVTLELGGKSPCIVDSSANLEVSVSRIAWCKWMNAGQTCVAPDYVIVEKHYVDTFVSALTAKIKQFYGEDNGASSADYARIVNARHWRRIKGYFDGQKVAHGGQCDEDSLYIGPSLIVEPKLDSLVMKEEIFGPILPIITVTSIVDAIELINQRPKPLAMYLFTKNSDLESRVLTETTAGSMCINDGMMFMANKKLPFGGVGTSGMGRYSGQSGFDTFSHLKAVMKRSFALDVDLRYPPYTNDKLKWLKRLG